jgi:hypothetical protein
MREKREDRRRDREGLPQLTRAGVALRCAGAAASVIGAIACGRPVAEDECRTLIERYTELLVKEEEPAASPERVARVQTEAHAAAEKNPQFQLSECSKKVSRRNYECAMHAGSVDAIERCLVF